MVIIKQISYHASSHADARHWHPIMYRLLFCIHHLKKKTPLKGPPTRRESIYAMVKSIYDDWDETEITAPRPGILLSS